VTSRLARLPLRRRLVLGFLVAMLVLLLAAGGFVYWRVLFALDRGLDRDLDQAISALGPLVTEDGRITDETAVAAAGVSYQVLDADGTVLSASGAPPDQSLLPMTTTRKSDHSIVRRDVGGFLLENGKPLRVEVSPLGGSSPGQPAYLLAAVRRDQRDEALRELLLQLALAGLGVLLVTALVGDRLARAALAPVERYRRRASEVAGGELDLRLDVPEGRDDEVTRLGHTLNDMLAALEQAMLHERRFVDDASHELRTPLTLLRTRVQLARRRTRTVAEHEAVLDELAVDVERLIALSEQLLALGADGAPPVRVDAAAALAAVLARRSDDPAPGREVGADVGEVELPDHAFERVVDNLLDNALLHGSPPVTVSLARRGDWVELAVADAGPGMDPDTHGTATERFARAPEARSRPGAGLGLALVRAIVEDGGGRLRVCSGGRHETYGADVDLPCRHDGRMTVSVLLPGA
jgi:signal transduction histidine kinase